MAAAHNIAVGYGRYNMADGLRYAADDFGY